MSGNARSAPELSAAEALDDPSFAALMARLGPFERRPRLAVAVSGGPDSTALCLLARRWSAARGGSVVGLTVDHRLRPDSAAEARRVGAWLAARGIEHRVLTWTGPRPASAIQARARAARYALLAAWCRRHGVLHLLVAHHLEDQAETVALRQEMKSGPDGLAAMPAIRELEGVRLLRPLLGVRRGRLFATLSAAGQPWVEDPANRADRFTRSRLRRTRLPVARLAEQAAAMAARRAALDRRAAAFLVDTARIDPAGFVTVASPDLRHAPPDLAARVLRQILAVVGGSPYPPRSARLEALCGALRAGDGFRGRTLAGCRILPWGERVLFCREPAAIDGPLEVVPGDWQRFDDRFAVRLAADRPGLVVRALGRDGARQRGELTPGAATRALPGPVRAGLPSVWCGETLLLVPHLDLARPGAGPLSRALAVRFRPVHPLAGAPFDAPIPPP